MEQSHVLGILGAVLWPIVTVIALLIFRLPVMRLANEIAARTKKLSYKGVSVEFEPLPVLMPAWDVVSGTKSQDVRQLTAAEIFDSYTHSLFEQLLHPRQADYAVVDLGRGQKWLTSRLFIFSLILGEVSHLKALVFLETTDSVRRRFLGIATPHAVCAALARRYPWFDQAFSWAHAMQYGPILSDVLGQSRFPSTPYILDVGAINTISQLVQKYIANIQRETDPPPSELESYLAFQTTVPPAPSVKTIWERGEWIDAEKLENDLGECLELSWYADLPERSEQERNEGIRRRRSRFVALVDEDRRFTGLVDRYSLVLGSKEGSRENGASFTS